MVTWILVAHRGGARIFRSRGPGAPLELLENIPHPEGRAQDKDLDSDKPGREFKLSAPFRSAAEPRETTHDHVAEAFARQLAQTCDLARARDDLDFLILVADPRFLGRLKAALPNPTLKKVVATLGKDLSWISDRDLPQHLGELMEVWQAAMLPTGT